MIPEVGKWYLIDNHHQKGFAKCIAIVNAFNSSFDCYLMQFINPIINGHDGYPEKRDFKYKEGKSGKMGYCWNVIEREVVRELTIDEVRVEVL